MFCKKFVNIQFHLKLYKLLTEDAAISSGFVSPAVHAILKLWLEFLSTHRKFLFFHHQYQQQLIPTCQLFCCGTQMDAFVPSLLLAPCVAAAVVCILQNYLSHTAAMNIKTNNLFLMSLYFDHVETYNSHFLEMYAEIFWFLDFFTQVNVKS